MLFYRADSFNAIPGGYLYLGLDHDTKFVTFSDFAGLYFLLLQFLEAHAGIFQDGIEQLLNGFPLQVKVEVDQ